ncbi:MAG: hypothetical protein CMI08_06150 [Oceanospirillaceae bacterium]|uniref:hypothetical protein n=1 Tax=unclassified Thalassolituus TaxID=2624967 RepID=UPI000C41BDFF|nr:MULTISPECIES: hypothetical protein [unclassified Thalassolituus]MAS25625.1 hypothetical protein [Oceanospirillaceae bacterium]MAX98777.1 hypothetical protein [Oceanospirillaceae bacterium]MBL35685.1 hypothetical protein [Oceanospirillaceae bacterium]MBS52214.1 hypothetical protein [Oceanospirillaceae bacterium]|tara:strand:+ start:1022 stop:1852 length:831 start_codon:yes stop_codon:yes gene_type:complete
MPTLLSDEASQHGRKVRATRSTTNTAGKSTDAVAMAHAAGAQTEALRPANVMERGRIQALYNDVYWVQGEMPGYGNDHRRNMVIVRDGHQLTLINPVRLSPLQERNLQYLGRIAHVLRLGDEPTADEHYYRSRYYAALWALPGQVDKPRHNILKEDAPLPIAGARLLKLEHSRRSQAVLLLERHGLLLSDDLLQHYGNWQNLSLKDQLLMRLQGFHKGMNLSRHWLRSATAKDFSLKDDIQRILTLNFDALLGASGTPMMLGAKQALHGEIDNVFH